MPIDSSILTETNNRVGVIRLNRPQTLNALNSQSLKELMDVLERFDQDPRIGAMIITGNERVFAAGAEVGEIAHASAMEMLHSNLIAQFGRIGRIQKPVIAAVSGWCLGGGCELAMSCDMIIASETARFGQPEIQLGVIPGAGGTQRLTKAVGKAIAMEMILNNRTLTAEEALNFGLINRVVPVERYLEEAVKLATEIAARPPIAIQLAKQLINHAFDSHLSEGLIAEKQAFILLFTTEDQKEGMAAFLEKRTPEWKGR